jgi:NADP-dependent 3-hydroxy acid dehydrogenase YdfG
MSIFYKQKIVAITGATSGIGKAMAIRPLAAGCQSS